MSQKHEVGLFREDFIKAQARQRHSRPAPSYRAIFFLPTLVMGATLTLVAIAATTVSYVPIVWAEAQHTKRIGRHSVGVPIEGIGRVETIAVGNGQVVQPGSPIAYILLGQGGLVTAKPAENNGFVSSERVSASPDQQMILIKSVSSGYICGRSPARGDFVSKGQELTTICFSESGSDYTTTLPAYQAYGLESGRNLDVRLTTWRGVVTVEDGLLLKSISPKLAADGRTVQGVILNLEPTKELLSREEFERASIKVEVGVDQERTSVGSWLLSRLGVIRGRSKQ